MRISQVTSILFSGKREDRNTVKKLAENNDYSLTELNQRRINEAIENLAKIQSESNIKFLLDTAKNLKYNTNIKNNKPSRQDWKGKLNNAVTDATNSLPENTRKKYEQEIQKVFSEPKELTKEEKEILESRETILSLADFKSLENLKNENTKNLERNLDYFIISTETTTKQKNYVLKRLAYFMSDKYKINPQLKDKKTLALAEMISDLVITTPESKTPNIKEINQRSHGMCADISISRKALAYEDKPNYTDAILSELDATDSVMVYDRMNLGSKKRVPVKKNEIDFDYALEKGYRIVDTAALQWMQIAGMYGNHNEIIDVYTGFDKENFDANNDSFYHASFADEYLAENQSYYQALVKADSELSRLKANKIAKNEKKEELRKNTEKNLELIKSYSGALRKNIQILMPDASQREIDKIFKYLISLETSDSYKLSKDTSEIKSYKYLPNEEDIMKKKKITLLLNKNYEIKTDKKTLEETVAEILELSDCYNEVSNNSLNNNRLKVGKISRAESLYTAEAAYRAQVKAGISIPEIREYYMTIYDIKDDETSISEGLTTLIQKIDNPKNTILLSTLAEKLDLPEDKRQIKTSIIELKKAFDKIMTIELDYLYDGILQGSRINVLNKKINESLNAIKTNNENMLEYTASKLQLPNDKETVIKKLNELKTELQDKKNYTKVLNEMGYKNQVEMFSSLYESLAVSIFEIPELTKRFNKAHGLSPNAPEQDTLRVLDKIKMSLDNIELVKSTCQDLLEIEDENGNTLNTISAKKIILNKLENEGELIPEKTMKKLQDRFTKIDKLSSEDHMNRKRGKIKDKSLTQLSKEEKDALNKISKSINKKYADTLRNLKAQQNKIKKPLEELNRYIGLNSGTYWVNTEGSSGLFDSQQIKIYEQLTDRPYYSAKNTDKAIAQLKKSDYSGISSTSVSHTNPGWHAQYIADIKEEMINGERKDVLYHDNSWGTVEKENTWVDSNGMTRTDYACGRGGALGYITNDRLFNGNIVENLNKKGHSTPSEIENRVYKKIAKPDDGYKFNMLTSIKLNGDNPNAQNIVARIQDNRFIYTAGHLPELINQATKMSQNELKNAFDRIENAGSNYHNKYSKIKEQILADKTITSETDFDKLANDNSLKIELEKVAIRQSYYSYDLLDKIAIAKTMDELANIRSEQEKLAKENLEYRFSKNKDIIKYITRTNQTEALKILSDISNKYGLNIPQKNLIKILKSAENTDDKEFNGSLTTTVNLITTKIIDEFLNNKTSAQNSDTISKELETELRKFISKKLYFNKSDLNMTFEPFSKIAARIDEIYNPETDEEFVKIYRKLQDMTKSEFIEFKNKIDLKTMGLNKISGFDVFNKFKNEDSKTISDLKNSIYYEELLKDITFSTPQTVYQYNKTYRESNGAIYKEGKSFDETYRDFYFELSALETEKILKGMRDSALRDAGSYPAFPSIDTINKESTEKYNNELIDTIMANINEIKNCKLRQKLYNTSDLLDAHLKSISNKTSLTSGERDEIDKLLTMFTTATYNERTCQKLHKEISELAKSESDEVADNYKKTIKTITKEINQYRSNNGKPQTEQIEEFKQNIKKASALLINGRMHPKYIKNLYGGLKSWINAEIKNSSKAATQLAELKSDLDKYLVLNYPTDLLKETLLTHAKDSKPDADIQKGYESYCESLFALSSIVGMQEIIMDIVSSGDVSSIKKELEKKVIEMEDKNGNSYNISLGSDEMLKEITLSLITEDNYETAVMFTEKLGLTDSMVKILTEETDFNKSEKLIAKLHRQVRSLTTQSEVIEKVFNKYIRLINNTNYSKVITHIKQDVIDGTEKLHYKDGIKRFLQIIDLTEEFCQNNPQVQKSEILRAYKDSILDDVKMIIKEKVEYTQYKLEPLELVYNFINSLYIPENTDTYIKRSDFNQEFNELCNEINMI